MPLISSLKPVPLQKTRHGNGICTNDIRNAVCVAKVRRIGETGGRYERSGNAHSDSFGHRHRAWLMVEPTENQWVRK